MPPLQQLSLTPVYLGADAADQEGRLVFVEGHLVAVLVQLAEGHEAAGHWFLEHGFGKLDVPVPPTFPDLQAAETWILARLNGVVDGGATLVPFPSPHTLPSRLLWP